MNSKKRSIILVLVVVVIILVISCLIILNRNKSTSDDNIALSKEIDISDLTTTYDENDISYVTLSNQSVEIKNGGTYYLTGEIEDGRIVIRADNEVVRLILAGVDISCSNQAPIYIEKAQKVIITLEENTVNNIEDGNTYTETEEGIDGAIYSKSDLTINGNGTLNVVAHYLDGIVSKDNLLITGGNINIESNDDGIRGKDSLVLQSVNLTVNSKADGLKATNDTDTSLGYIQIDSGTIKVTSGEDGIQAETSLLIRDGNITLVTGGGSDNTSADSSWGTWNQRGRAVSDTTSASAKGLKANTVIQISGGTIVLDTSDDAIHSNNEIVIDGGDITVTSGDDGVHANNKLTINDGLITITKSYEGLESSELVFNGGDIKVTASDDGMNAAGGNDSSSTSGRPGMNQFKSSTGSLTINGGNILIDASGDGLDANGNIVMTGGTVIVLGPTDSGNGSLDYDSTFNISGGTLLAIGSSGMSQATSNSSSQYAFMINTQTYQGGTIQIKDENDNQLISYTTEKSFSSILYSSTNLSNGSTYTVYVDDNKASSIKLTGVVTTSGNSSNGMNGNRPR